MTITHHPDDATLMCCSAGCMPEALAAVMAAHISMCPRCRQELAAMQEIGVALFQSLAPVATEKPAPVIALRAGEADCGRTRTEGRVCGDVPLPLVGAVGRQLCDIKWTRIAPGLWQKEIPLSANAKGDLRLIKVAPGVAIPEHGHEGPELTLVLQGAYRDQLGTFSEGDVADLDSDVEHRPVADEKTGCICLIASQGKRRFKSLLARAMQPFTGL